MSHRDTHFITSQNISSPHPHPLSALTRRFPPLWAAFRLHLDAITKSREALRRTFLETYPADKASPSDSDGRGPATPLVSTKMLSLPPSNFDGERSLTTESQYKTRVRIVLATASSSTPSPASMSAITLTRPWTHLRQTDTQWHIYCDVDCHVLPIQKRQGL
jgi:hypothetical protein